MIAMQQNSQNALNIWRVIYIVHKLILEIQQRKIKKKNFKKLKHGHKTIKNMNVLFYDSDTNVVVQ
jgi:hypothetical protein